MKSINSIFSIALLVSLMGNTSFAMFKVRGRITYVDASNENNNRGPQFLSPMYLNTVSNIESKGASVGGTKRPKKISSNTRSRKKNLKNNVKHVRLRRSERNKKRKIKKVSSDTIKKVSSPAKKKASVKKALSRNAIELQYMIGQEGFWESKTLVDPNQDPQALVKEHISKYNFPRPLI